MAVRRRAINRLGGTLEKPDQAPVCSNAQEAALEKLTLSVSEASAATGLSVATLHRHITAGTLKSRLVGRRRLIDAASLREFVGIEAA